ncbi:LANO_0F01882g1_1 [Lachancea nothofagi CBS 11611]|uniref:RNA helicase n=1 Tax=Lachancea nothofagi CBS 11611 TaxID=1266666 RepID=A0A1G4K6G7_9SACH|nr:LANO_0F01882g1_1 [Lachancea nothofagi CBS 11611]
MSSVSAEEKKRLLLERRNKWKQKKADFEASKVQQETNQNNSDGKDEQDNKLSNRRAKLDYGRQNKGLQAQQNSDEVKTKRNGMSDKKLSRKRIFNDSDDEEDRAVVKLFRPSDLKEPEENHKNASESVSSTSPLENDPLEMFMQNLSKSSDQGSKRELLIPHALENDGSDEELDPVGLDDHDDVETEFRRLRKLKSKKRVKKLCIGEKAFEPFTKVFYSEPEEIQKMTETEVEELRLSLDNVIVKGQGCPRPILRWSQLGLTTEIMNLITQELKFLSPTPIQAQAFPTIMSGRDVIGISKTGSGKTVSFLLPLLRHIKAARPLSKEETGPLGLILAPTRELAVQIHEEICLFTKDLPELRSVCCTGGSELKQQINDLKRGVEIVVATPGRFIDLLTLNSGKLLNTERVTFVVIDEADRLFDLGFEPQITEIMKTIRPDKQCVLFSATFPTKLKSFASRMLNKPISITINSKSLINENIEQRLELYESDEEKFEGLQSLLDSQTAFNHATHEDRDEKTIVFVSSQQICDLVHNKLLEQNYTTFAIHAGKPYNERATNLEKFKKTKNGILLCTEVLSRGLNVPEVSLVIIYNAVKSFAQYVHTTGRTARGDKHGAATTLLLDDELAAAYILNRSFRDSELNALAIGVRDRLKTMADKFESGMKTGKYRLTKGFGGKGLEHMEKLKGEKHDEELKQYGVSDQSKATPNADNGNDNSVDHIVVPKLQYTFLQNKNLNGQVTYSAEVNVNDLPQMVRWEATKNTTLSFVIHETACSITNRGKFYPEGTEPKTPHDEPKLYLLIEAQEEKDVRLAIGLLEEKVREGVKKVSVQEAKSSKFSL